MKILLLCSAGMSTSLLVQRMKEVAQKRALEMEIWACGDSQSDQEVSKADVVLIGPQMRFLLKRIQAMAQSRPVRVIDMMTYGRMDGEHAIELALQAWEEKEK